MKTFCIKGSVVPKLALRDPRRRPQDPQPGRQDHTSSEMLPNTAPSHPVGLTDPEQPERAVVAIRLHLPGQTRHPDGVHGEFRRPNRSRRLRERQRRSSAHGLSVRVRFARHHRSVFTTARQSRCQDGHQLAAQERADLVLPPHSRATRRIRQVFELARMPTYYRVQE